MKNDQEGIENAQVLVELINNEKNDQALDFLTNNNVDLSYMGEYKNFMEETKLAPIFHIACKKRMPSEFLQTLINKVIENDGDLNAKDKEYGYNYLMQANSYCRVDIVQSLIDTKKVNINDVDNKGESVFFKACDNWRAASSSEESMQVVNILLNEKNLEINCRNQKGVTPLNKACTYGYSDLVKLLIENGADLSLKDNEGFTPLMSTTKNLFDYSWGKGVVEVLNYLFEIEKDLKINETDNKGNTALHLLLRKAWIGKEYKTIIDNFVKRSDLTIKNENGLTSFQLALKNDSAVVLDSILHHSEYDEKTKVSTMFANIKKASILGCFLDNGVSIDATDEKGDNLLKHALDSKQSIYILKELMNRKLDLNAESNVKVINSWIEGYAEKSKLKNVKIEKLVNDYLSIIKKLSSKGVVFEKSNTLIKIIFDVLEHCSKEILVHLDFLKPLIDVNKDTNEKGELLIHCAKGNVKLINFLIEKFNADPTIKTPDEETILLNFIYANSKFGNARSIKMEIDELFKSEKMKSIVNTPNSSGETPLHWACEKGNFAMVEKLIENGANPIQLNNHKCSPLMFAINAAPVLERFVEVKKVIEFLLKQKGVCESINDFAANGKAAIHFTCEKGDKEIINLLIKNGADTNLKDNSGMTPFAKYLTTQTKNIDLELVKLLFNKDIDLNQNYEQKPVLLYACIKNSKEVVEFLVENGANIKFIDETGYNFIHYAAHGGNIPTIEYLLANGLDINCTNAKGFSPLHTACSNGNVPVIKYLIENGADINVKNNNLKNEPWRTPFYSYIMSVSKNIDIDLLKLLLPKDFNVNEASTNGMTALHLLSQKGCVEAFKFLIDKGFDVDKKTVNNNFALLHAINIKNVEIVKLILNKSTSTINDEGSNGFIPLHLACNKGNKEIIKLLVKNGADINLKNKEGKLAIDLVENYLKRSVEEIFKTTEVNKHEDINQNITIENNLHTESEILGENNDNHDN